MHMRIIHMHMRIEAFVQALKEKRVEGKAYMEHVYMEGERVRSYLPTY